LIQPCYYRPLRVWQSKLVCPGEKPVLAEAITSSWMFSSSRSMKKPVIFAAMEVKPHLK
jgi:hypothetical protein